MKKGILIVLASISLYCSAQDSAAIHKAILLEKLHQSFSGLYRVESVDPVISLKQDSLFLPVRYLLRAYLFLPDESEPVKVYFFDARRSDSLWFHYYQNIFSKSCDSGSTETHLSVNSNREYIAISFCPSEKICERLCVEFENNMGMAMPIIELKLVEIKQEEKEIEPPPPPPPRPKAPKIKLKKKV